MNQKFSTVIIMKRNMDLVREILLEVEKLNDGESTHASSLNIEGYSKEEIAYNAYIMLQKNLIYGHLMHMEQVGRVPPFYISDLTWDGHDFLDACRDKTRWEKAKGIFDQVGGVSFDVAKNVLINLATDAVKNIM